MTTVINTFTSIVISLFFMGECYSQNLSPKDSSEFCCTYTFTEEDYNKIDPGGMIYTCGLPTYGEIFCIPEDSNQVLFKEKIGNDGSYSIGFFGLRDLELSTGEMIKCWMRVSARMYFTKDDTLVKIEMYDNQVQKPLQQAKVILTEE